MLSAAFPTTLALDLSDVITLIGSTPVNSVEAFERAVDKLSSGASVPLRLIRRGNPMFIGLKLAD